MAPRMHEFLFRVKALFQKRRMDREMAEELAFHQAMKRSKLMGQGASKAEADAAARRAFGNESRWQERLRELWQFRRLENLGRDVSFSARVLAKSPGFTAVALLTLALGVGANTTVFSMINGLLLRPLAVPESNRLAVIGVEMGRPQPNYSFSEPVFRGIEGKREVFSEIFAFSSTTMQVKGGDGNENESGQWVSGGFFNALKTAPLLGRTLTAADDVKGGNPAGFGAVISEAYWQRRFNRSPSVIGQKLTIDNTNFTVVGVMPKGFFGADPLQRPALFLPLTTEPVLNGLRSMTAAGVHGWWMTVMGRLQPGVTIEQANAQLSSISNAVFHQVPSDARWLQQMEKGHSHFVVENGSAGFTYVRLNFRKPLTAVFAMCGGILLLACLNLASLLMARGAARQNELATRLALGATRSRLVQQLLVESLLIALVGTALGLAISPLVGDALATMLLGGRFEVHVDTSLDIRVFAFAALAAIVAALLVGLVPALQATSGRLNEHIKGGQHTTQAHERKSLLPRVMMASEVAVALMLVVGAGLLASSLVRLYLSGAGFEAKGLQNIRFSMDKEPLKGEALLRFYRDLGEGLRRQPGVSDVSFARIVPFTHSTWDEGLAVGEGKEQDTYENTVGPNYFRTMGIPLFAGREFNWSDTPSTGLKVILNQAAVKLLFGDRNPIGQTVISKDDKVTFHFEVVGVVGNAKYENLRDAAPPTAYVAMTQDDNQMGASYYAVVRSSGPEGALAEAARSISKGLDAGIPAPVMESMATTVDESLSTERVMAMLAVFFAACALMVTAVGLYGTLAYATERRTSEIGIRMALGAQRAQVVGMVFRQNASIALVGTAAGLIAALLASRALASFLYGVSARDPWVFAGSILMLALIASAASLLPALRSARINPISAIRCE